jgi:hypothetical protein
MQRVLSVIVLALIVWLPACHPREARAIGVYEDAVGQAGFLFAPQRGGVRGAVIRTNDSDLDASIFSLAVNYSLRQNLLLQLEQPYVTLIDPADIESGFGDLHARARLRLVGGDGRALHAIGGLRLGTGTRRLFPYSSQSFDLELALGYVDSLDVLHVWASAGGGFVERLPDALSDPPRHADFSRLGGGFAFPFGSAIYLRLGACGLLYRGGGAREIYFSQLQYRRSNSIELRAAVHAEAGESVERVSDLALTVSILAFL